MYSFSNSLFNFYDIKINSDIKYFNITTSKMKMNLMKIMSLYDYEKILDPSSDFLKILIEKNYLTSPQSTLEAVFESIQETFHHELKAMVKSLHEVYPSKKVNLIQHFLFTPYDLLNLKIIYKNLHQENNFNTITLQYYGLENKDFFQKLFMRQKPHTSHFLQNYINRFSKLSIDSIYDIDIMWDKYIHEFYLNIVKLLNSDLIKRFFILKTDIKNILTLYRLKGVSADLSKLKSLYIDGGTIHYNEFINLFKKSTDELAYSLNYLPYHDKILQGIEYYKKFNSFSELNKLLDQYENNLLIRASRIAQGIDLLAVYYWIKNKEIENLRIILSSRWSNIDSQWSLSKVRTIV